MMEIPGGSVQMQEKKIRNRPLELTLRKERFKRTYKLLLQ